MADKVVEIPGVGVVVFPDSLSDAEIASTAKNLTLHAQKGGSPETWPALAGAIGAKLFPAATTAAESFATNPDAWKTGKAIGEAVGGITGLVKGGPLGAAGGMWVGSKAGWRLANAAQKVVAPIASAMDAAKPYVAGAGNTLAAATGVGDLAQMAEPERKDIGVVGVGATQDIDWSKVAKSLTAMDAIKWRAYQQRGMTPEDALSLVMQQKGRKAQTADVALPKDQDE